MKILIIVLASIFALVAGMFITGTRMTTAGCKVYVVFGEDQAQALVSHLISVSRSGVEEQYA